MGKKNKSRQEKPIRADDTNGFNMDSTETSSQKRTKLPFLGSSSHVDPNIASLFAQSVWSYQESPGENL